MRGIVRQRYLITGALTLTVIAGIAALSLLKPNEASTLTGNGTATGPAYALFQGGGGGSTWSTLTQNQQEGSVAPIALDQTSAVSAFNAAGWKTWVGTVYSGTAVKQIRWRHYMTANRVFPQGQFMRGDQGPNRIDTNYLISHTFTLSNTSQPGNSVQWQGVGLRYQALATDTMRFYYRVSDEGGTTDPNDAGWTKLDLRFPNRDTLVKLPINKVGKYFQYKVHLATNRELLHVVALGMQGVSGATIASPKPSTAPSSTPTGNPDGSGSGSESTPTPTVSGKPTGNGRITIVTKRIGDPEETVVESPAAESSSGPLLPDLTQPAGTPTPAVSPGVNNLCYSDQDTEEAANVTLTLKHSEGFARVDNQRTDHTGIWHGLNGNVDQFPTGQYELRLGEFQKTDYKLIALCVEPDNGEHYLKTSVDLKNRKLNIKVLNGKETRVIALYGLRTKPYVSMSKLAVDGTLETKGARKVLTRLYPGQQFLWLIRYQNPTEADAKGLVIRDVLPEQVKIQKSEEDKLEEKYGIKVERDAKERTLITKTVGDLKKGEKGAFFIPVYVDPDSFVPGTVANPR